MKAEALARVLQEMFPVCKSPQEGPIHYMHVVVEEERRVELRRRLQQHPKDTTDDGLESELDELDCDLGGEELNDS